MTRLSLLDEPLLQSVSLATIWKLRLKLKKTKPGSLSLTWQARRIATRSLDRGLEQRLRRTALGALGDTRRTSAGGRRVRARWRRRWRAAIPPRSGGCAGRPERRALGALVAARAVAAAEGRKSKNLRKQSSNLAENYTGKNISKRKQNLAHPCLKCRLSAQKKKRESRKDVK